MYEPIVDNTGPNLGKLAVWTRTRDRDDNAVMTPLWRLQNGQGPSWKPTGTGSTKWPATPMAATAPFPRPLQSRRKLALGLAKGLLYGVARTIGTGGVLDGLLSGRFIVAFLASGLILISRAFIFALHIMVTSVHIFYDSFL